jgi:hypothetical protein
VAHGNELCLLHLCLKHVDLLLKFAFLSPQRLYVASSHGAIKNVLVAVEPPSHGAAVVVSLREKGKSTRVNRAQRSTSMKRF